MKVSDMMDDASTIEELLAGQDVSNHHKVSMFSEMLCFQKTLKKNDKLTILQESQQPNFGAVKAENGGREREQVLEHGRRGNNSSVSSGLHERDMET